MTERGRSGCWLPLLGCVLGGLLGASTAFVIGMIDGPVVDPADPLAHEGYTPYALIVLPFYALIIGAFVGLLAGFACKGAAGKAAASGCTGLVLGLVIGMALPDGEGSAFRPTCHSLLAATLGCLGLFLACQSARGSSWQADEIRERDGYRLL
jgi:hypothetical protein